MVGAEFNPQDLSCSKCSEDDYKYQKESFDSCIGGYDSFICQKYETTCIKESDFLECRSNLPFLIKNNKTCFYKEKILDNVDYNIYEVSNKEIKIK